MATNGGFQSDEDVLKKRTLKSEEAESPPSDSNIIDMNQNNETDSTAEDEDFGALEKNLRKIKNKSSSFCNQHRKIIRYLMLAILNGAILAYFFVALAYWYEYSIGGEWDFCDGFGMLLILYSLTYFFLIYFLIVKPFFGKPIYKKVLKPFSTIIYKVWEYKIAKLAVTILILGGFITFVVLDTVGSRERLISIGGYCLLLLLGFVLSKHPGRVKWRPVILGVIFHFILGLLTIRWDIGRAIFQCMGDKVNTFLSYAADGALFVFGNFLVIDQGVFAFAVLPVIFFFSMIIEILFYWGAMQWICLKLGWLLQVSMGTTVCESVIVAANIFLGMSESPLLIKPYIPALTKSEIHSIMTSGFGTVSGSVLAAYISFGANPSHLITASVMAAPAALCFSKLVFPETKESKTDVKNLESVGKTYSSVLEAATAGSSNAIFLVLNIAANLVAFVAMVAFINGILSWLGMLVGLEFLTLEWLLGKIFMPLSFVLGVAWEECEIVGELIGLKTVVNEFVAYEKLGEFKEAGLISPRAAAIATYALCGFTNPSSLGILVGALSAMAPTKKADITNVAVRALLCGCAVCFMSACLAGLLMSPDSY